MGLNAGLGRTNTSVCKEIGLLYGVGMSSKAHRASQLTTAAYALALCRIDSQDTTASKHSTKRVYDVASAEVRSKILEADESVSIRTRVHSITSLGLLQSRIPVCIRMR